jgi:hypothetical protein
MPTKRIPVLILGSCVSRDTLELASETFEVENYLARSSFASAWHPLRVVDNFSRNLQSKFQSRMVAADLNKSVAHDLSESKAELVLLDFIDERFDLFLFNDGSVCTISNELLATGFKPDPSLGSIIESGTPEFLRRWKLGWGKFLEHAANIGIKDKIRLNCVYWSLLTEAGNDFRPSYSNDRISRANNTLKNLYAFAARTLPADQLITYPENAFLGDDDHKWGKSPFHYRRALYESTLEQLSFGNGSPKSHKSNTDHSDAEISQGQLPASIDALLSGREILKLCLFPVTTYKPIDLSLRHCETTGNFRKTLSEDCLKFEAVYGNNTHHVTLSINDAGHWNGIGARVRLTGWKSIRYVALGYLDSEKYVHVKVTQPLLDGWTLLYFQLDEIGFGLQHNWERPTRVSFDKIRIYIHGEASITGTALDVSHLILWEEPTPPDARTQTSHFSIINLDPSHIEERVTAPLQRYLERCFPKYVSQAEAYITEGLCPLYGNVLLEWHETHRKPAKLPDVGTYAFSWHSLHHCAILLLYHLKTGSTGAIVSAFELASLWIENSYLQPDEDRKFTWYDHGTAERQMVLLLLAHQCVKQGVDKRLTKKILGVLLRQAQLLASEQFYASHQASRYHNHAWFQDIALLATGLAFPTFASSSYWIGCSLSRLRDQLSRLIVNDQSYAVFVENSIGYHNGIQRLIGFAGELASQVESGTSISDTSERLGDFSTFLKYPDGRSPAQGDTFRRPNPTSDLPGSLPAYDQPTFTVLSNAGYAVAKGNHENSPYMLCVFCTSLSKTHKHADDCSFTLFFDGIEWLIDPSFFSHEYKSQPAADLRSAARHNMVVVEDCEYSIEPGLSELRGESDGDEYLISCTSRNFKDHTTRRSIRGSLSSLDLKFNDIVERDDMSGNASLMLHCGDGVSLTEEDSNLILSHNNSNFDIVISTPPELNNASEGQQHWSFINSVSGLGFMEVCSTTTIKLSLDMTNGYAWKISARFK